MVLNEKKYAMKVLETYEYSEKLTTTLSLITKYLYYYQGKSDSEIIDVLDDFMRKTQSDYNKVSWLKCFDNTIKFAKKYPMVEIDSIPITQKELDTIATFKTKQEQKTMFSLLCYAKYYNAINSENNNWVNVENKVIFKSANVTKKTVDQAKMCHNFAEHGYLAISRNIKSRNKQVTFVDNENKGVLFIKNFDDLGYQYLRHNGENYTECVKCGKLIKNNKQCNIKYCNDCTKLDKVDFKIIKCIDCGNDVVVDNRNTKTNRCPECFIKYKREYDAIRKREARQKSKESTNEKLCVI